MKKNKGTDIYLIGMGLLIVGMTMLSDYKIFYYTTMILGLLVMIYSVFVTDRWKKSQDKI